MASTVPTVRDYASIIIRLKFIKGSKSLAPCSLSCRCGATNDVFSIEGLVGAGEIPIAAILRYLRELAGFRWARDFPMVVCNVILG